MALPSGSTQYQYGVNPNGLVIGNNGAFQPLVPQGQYWDLYANMYQFYQVKKFEFKFYPYRYQGNTPIGTSSLDVTVLSNTFSITAPTDVFPATTGISSQGDMLSFGNCSVRSPYQEHTRVLRDFTDLGLSKQNEIILKTNDSAAQRQKYQNVSTLWLLAFPPSFFNSTIPSVLPLGDFIYTVEYEFSGMKLPGLDSVPIHDSAYFVEDYQSDVLEDTSSIAQTTEPQQDENHTDSANLITGQTGLVVQPVDQITDSLASTVGLLRAQLSALAVRE